MITNIANSPNNACEVMHHKTYLKSPFLKIRPRRADSHDTVQVALGRGFSFFEILLGKQRAAVFVWIWESFGDDGDRNLGWSAVGWSRDVLFIAFLMPRKRSRDPSGLRPHILSFTRRLTRLKLDLPTPHQSDYTSDCARECRLEELRAEIRAFGVSMTARQYISLGRWWLASRINAQVLCNSSWYVRG
jgi:hypothetical protein